MQKEKLLEILGVTLDKVLATEEHPLVLVLNSIYLFFVENMDVSVNTSMQLSYLELILEDMEDMKEPLSATYLLNIFEEYWREETLTKDPIIYTSGLILGAKAAEVLAELPKEVWVKLKEYVTAAKEYTEKYLDEELDEVEETEDSPFDTSSWLTAFHSCVTAYSPTYNTFSVRRNHIETVINVQTQISEEGLFFSEWAAAAKLEPIAEKPYFRGKRIINVYYYCWFTCVDPTEFATEELAYQRQKVGRDKTAKLLLLYEVPLEAARNLHHRSYTHENGDGCVRSLRLCTQGNPP